MRKINFSLLPVIIILAVFICTTGFSCDYNDHEYFKDNSTLNTLHEKTFKTQSGKMIELNASMADVNISSWNKNEVYIKVLGNSKAANKLDFYFNEENGNITVNAEKKGVFSNWFSHGIHLRFEIKVPSKFNTESNTSGGDVTIIAVDGKTYIKTSGGDIALQDITGDIYASTSGGDITGKYLKGVMVLKSSGGDIKTSNTTGDLSAKTSGGDITFSANNAKIDASTSGGDIIGSYKGENLGIDVHTSGGSILLKLPENFNASAKLSTSGGYIECDHFLANVEKKSKSKIIADFNNGGPRLKVSTSGGDISILKNL